MGHETHRPTEKSLYLIVGRCVYGRLIFYFLSAPQHVITNIYKEREVGGREEVKDHDPPAYTTSYYSFNKYWSCMVSGAR